MIRPLPAEQAVWTLPVSPDCAEACTRLCLQRAKLETDLLSLVLRAPRLLVPLAEAEGVSTATFREPDTLLIWCAIDVARDRDVPMILRLATRALDEDGFWVDAGAISDGPPWHATSLVWLATRADYDVDATRDTARRLVSLSRRLDRVARLIRVTERAIYGSPELRRCA